MSNSRGQQGLAGLTLGALGVVYGDIGTSPLYTIKEIFSPATGIWQIVKEPTIVQALDPRRAFDFLRERGWQVFAAVGAIVLALTGAEALYADMGHFGRRPIQIAWTGIVLPALALNYMGQGALLMRDPGALDNPFF